MADVVTQNESSHVKIHCDTTSPGPVTWKFNGADLEQVDFAYHQEQLDLMVEEVDQPMLGEYSCWRNGVQLSSTHLLEEDVVNDEHFKSFLRCWAKSYDCHFSCEWNHSVYSTVRLGLGSNCSQGLTSCQWVQSSHRTLKGKLHFDIAHHLTPFAEETDVLTLTVEAFADHYSYYSNILRKTRHFFLRDIIQPDSPDIVKCEEEGIALNVTIEPPSSWSRPHSFFQLEHEIEYVSRDNGEHGTTTSILIPQGVSRLRVRSRDPLVMSRWSHWSKWKNVTDALSCV
ncbi:interleukin-12 subunit beta [Synchiropus picturatus]